MTTRIRLGISTCPNDTFAFHGLLSGRVVPEGLDLDIQLMDVEELNQRLMRREFEVAKASFHAALRLADVYGVLRCGSALGFGVGPLLLAARPGAHPTPGSADRVLCPGGLTTATLLYRLFYPGCGHVDQVVFSEIMPALVDRRADFGVCIHEGRFTWQQQGLALVEDLGTRWERETAMPLPLGGILARLDLGDAVLGQVHRAILDSILYGIAHREETLESMRRYAQEFSDDVLFAHVDLYVNQWTRDLGNTGAEALQSLHQRAVAVGLVPADQSPLRIVP